MPDSSKLSLKERLAAVNQSKFCKPKKQANPFSGFDWIRPADMPRPDASFSFDYDFEKYDLSGLGRLFGIPQWEVGDRCVRWICKWDAKVRSMYDFAGRQTRGDSSDYTAGTKDNYHSFGTYAAWHALALVGGELLLERPLVEVRSYEDPWDEWLLQYSITRQDGLWLADGTGKYPFFSLHDLMRDKDKTKPQLLIGILLLSLAGIGPDLSIDKRLVVSGSWNSPDQVHVSITSALVPAQQLHQLPAHWPLALTSICGSRLIDTMTKMVASTNLNLRRLRPGFYIRMSKFVSIDLILGFSSRACATASGHRMTEKISAEQ